MRLEHGDALAITPEVAQRRAEVQIEDQRRAPAVQAIAQRRGLAQHLDRRRELAAPRAQQTEVAQQGKQL